MSTTKTPPWVGQLVTALGTVVATWLALGEKMESVVDDRLATVKEEVRSYVDAQVEVNMEVLDDSINAKVQRATAELRMEMRNVGTNISQAVSESDRPLVVQQHADTAGNAAIADSLGALLQRVEAVMNELKRQDARWNDREPVKKPKR